MNDAPHLRHGSEWAEHEDYLVGNDSGLKRLREAIDIALRDSEYSGNDLDEFVGVKRLDSSWFKSPEDSKRTRYANKILAFVLVVAFAFFIVGVVTAARWFF